MTSQLFRHEALEEQKNRLYGEVVITQPTSIYLITFGILSKQLVRLLVGCLILALVVKSAGTACMAKSPSFPL